MLNSCLYHGGIRHRRLQPVKNAFAYSLFMMYLDLGELEEVFRGRWFWSVERRNLAAFQRRDHLGDPAVPLDSALRDLVQERTGRRPSGPVRLLTHLRFRRVGVIPRSAESDALTMREPTGATVSMKTVSTVLWRRANISGRFCDNRKKYG